MTDGGEFRVVAAVTTGAARQVAAAQGAAGDAARELADLVTGAVLFRELMAPDLRVQCILEGAGGRGRAVADSHPDGGVRGLRLTAGDPGAVATLPGSLLRMARELPRGGLHEGVVSIEGGGSLGEGLMRYLQDSEQVVAAVALGSPLDGEGIRASGGWVVQLLPEADRANLAILTERLAGFPPIGELLDRVTGAAGLVEELLGGWAFTRLEERAVDYRCRCSQAGVESAIATLATADLAGTVEDGVPLEIRCDWCRRAYTVELAFVSRLLAGRRRIN